MKPSNTTNPSETDWDRLNALDDTSIDFSDIPEITAELFATAVVRHRLQPMNQQSQLAVQVDGDVLAWFKNQGQDYQASINKLLRAYMNAHLNKTQVQLQS